MDVGTWVDTSDGSLPQEIENADASFIDVETLLLGNCKVEGAEYQAQGQHQG